MEGGKSRLSRKVSSLLADPECSLVFSVVSAWELILGMEPLSITMAHVLAAGNLPGHHRDPFDRMLIAQAQVEQLVIVTRDSQLRKYTVATIW